MPGADADPARDAGAGAGRDPVDLPAARAGSGGLDAMADLVNLSKVSRSSAEGALQCSITDTATGEVLARQDAVYGSSSGYVSIVCSAGRFAGPATIAPPIATSAAARPTTTTPRRPVTREASDAESDRLKSCMVRTGNTEAQCRAADGSDRLPSAAGNPTANLRACMEQTGMSAHGVPGGVGPRRGRLILPERNRARCAQPLQRPTRCWCRRLGRR